MELALLKAGAAQDVAAERARLAGDVHDLLGHALTSIVVQARGAAEALPPEEREARAVLERVESVGRDALAELRTLVRGLHPAILDDRGLDAALSGIAARAPVPVRLRVDMAARASPTVEAVAYFMVAEALANIAKHAHATSAGIEVRRHEDVLTVTVPS